MQPQSNKKPLYRIPADDLFYLAVGQEEEQNAHRLLRSSIENRRIISPSKFNPAFCDSLACKRVRKHPVNQKTPLVWDLPGHGKLGRGCGLTHSIIGCENADYFQRVKNHCWRFSCPTCSWDTSTRKAGEIVGRLMAYDHLRPRSLRFNPRDCWQHVTISPPQIPAKKMMGSSEGYAHLRQTAGEILRDLGAVGGVLVFHPFRQNGEDDYNNKLTTGNTGNINDWRTAPHFHAIICGFLDPHAIRDLYNSSKWVVKSIRAHLNEEQILGVTNYLLTHVGVGSIEGRRAPQSYQYIGELTTSHLQIRADLERIEKPVCPNCSGQLIRTSLSPASTMPTDYTEYVHLVEGSVYCLKEDREKVDTILAHATPYNFSRFTSTYAGLYYPTFTDTDELWFRGERPRIRDEFGVLPSANPRAVCPDHAASSMGDAACSGQTNPFTNPANSPLSPNFDFFLAGNSGEALSSFARPPPWGGRGRKGGDIPPP